VKTVLQGIRITEKYFLRIGRFSKKTIDAFLKVPKRFSGMCIRYSCKQKYFGMLKAEMDQMIKTSSGAKFSKSTH
jgi:hypothetical protein